MTEYTIYYNPNCTKSRASLALLNDRAVSLRVGDGDRGHSARTWS